MANISLQGDDYDDFFEIADYAIWIVSKSKPVRKPVKQYASKINKYFFNSSRNVISIGDTLIKSAVSNISKKDYDLFCSSLDKILSHTKTGDQQRLYEGFLAKYGELKKRLEILFLAQERKTTSVAHKQNQSGNGNRKSRKQISEFIKTFEHSKWFCYTVLEGNKLGRKTVQFSSVNKKGQLEVTIKHFINKLADFTGFAEVSSEDGTLMLHTTSYVKGKSTNYNKDYNLYYFKVLSTLDELELCIGHITFRHKHDDNIVSGAAVLQRCKENEKDFSVKKFDFKNAPVDDEILTLLRDRLPTRIETPAKTHRIYDLDTLRRYLKETKEKPNPDISKN